MALTLTICSVLCFVFAVCTHLYNMQTLSKKGKLSYLLLGLSAISQLLCFILLLAAVLAVCGVLTN